MAENTPAAEDNQAAQANAQEATPTTPETQAKETPDIPESFRKELEDARREAARYRTERNELRQDTEAWRTQQEAEKSELQKAQEALNRRTDEGSSPLARGALGAVAAVGNAGGLIPADAGSTAGGRTSRPTTPAHPR
ncbi:hypothetical protein CU7111_1885 [Corynebacterium urealyticum DSM 7111]|nr:hypothetical protein CU7111_1885 [Corynebacterium urealyticum DSM 7111]